MAFCGGMGKKTGARKDGVVLFNNYSAKSRRISPDTKPTMPLAELAKIRRYFAGLSRMIVE